MWQYTLLLHHKEVEYFVNCQKRRQRKVFFSWNVKLGGFEKRLRDGSSYNGVWWQKQPLEVLFKKRFSEKFCKVHRKTPVQDSLATLLKKRFWHRCFHVNFAKFLRILFLQNTSGWLLLLWQKMSSIVNVVEIARS